MVSASIRRITRRCLVFLNALETSKLTKALALASPLLPALFSEWAASTELSPLWAPGAVFGLNFPPCRPRTCLHERQRLKTAAMRSAGRGFAGRHFLF